jgi:hypothetical protein
MHVSACLAKKEKAKKKEILIILKATSRRKIALIFHKNRLKRHSLTSFYQQLQ